MKQRSRRTRGSAAVVVLAAYPRRPPALRAARSLVRDRLLACATVHGGATAIYRWKGRTHEERSTLLWGKTTSSAAAAAVEAIRAGHPDDVPEILVLRVAKAYAPYLRWLEATVGAAR